MTDEKKQQKYETLMTLLQHIAKMSTAVKLSL